MECRVILYVSCVFLMIAFSTTNAAAATHSLALYSSSKNGLSGFIDTDREKRSSVTLIGNAVARGMKAAEKLLKGSRLVTDEKRFYRYSRYGDEFEKPGDYTSIMKDFESVYPKGVKHYVLPKGNILTVGTVGDRTLYVKKFGAFGKPTLEILQNIGRPHEIKADVIIYTGKKL